MLAERVEHTRMRRFIQRILGGVLVLAGATACLLHSPETAPAVPAPDQKPYDETVPGSSVTFRMVPIPGGTFTMGSPAAEKGRGEEEGPQHPVTIRPFWMAETET